MREAACAGEKNPFLRLFRFLGPGITAGAADDDPSGIGTYAIAGALLGFSVLWMALVTWPIMAAVQYISAKIGLVTGEGISTLLRRYYPPWLSIGLALALTFANTITAGADIGAIAAAINLLVPQVPSAALVVPIGGALLAFQVWGSYRSIARVFKWLTLSLLAYVAAAFFVHPTGRELLEGTFFPHLRLNAESLTTLFAVLGATISPYAIFWQAHQEVEADIAAGRRFLAQRRGTTRTELRYAAFDIGIGMLFSNIVMYFIILVTAATLFRSGHHHIATAAEAAKALAPLAGHWATWLLALGLIGTGTLAVPILTASSAYALAGAFGWREGLSAKPLRAPQFYGAITLSMLVGMEINFPGIGALAALYWSSVINGFIAPLLLIALMLLSNDERVLPGATNGLSLNLLGWAAVVALILAAAALIALH